MPLSPLASATTTWVFVNSLLTLMFVCAVLCGLGDKPSAPGRDLLLVAALQACWLPQLCPQCGCRTRERPSVGASSRAGHLSLNGEAAARTCLTVTWQSPPPWRCAANPTKGHCFCSPRSWARSSLGKWKTLESEHGRSQGPHDECLEATCPPTSPPTPQSRSAFQA